MRDWEEDKWLVAALCLLIPALACLVAFALGGCAFHVTMTHQLKAPIRCLAIRNLGIMGVRCEHEPPVQDLQPPAGSEVPPL